MGTQPAVGAGQDLDEGGPLRISRDDVEDQDQPAVGAGQDLDEGGPLRISRDEVEDQDQPEGVDGGEVVLQWVLNLQ